MDVVQGGCLGALKLHVRVRVSSKRRRVSMCAGAIIHTSLLAGQRVFGERERGREGAVYTCMAEVRLCRDAWVCIGVDLRWEGLEIV